MKTQTEKFRQKLEKQIDKFSGQFMSNSKWTKLFHSLSEQHDLVKKCLIKDIGDSVIRQLNIPNTEMFADTFHETGIKDVMTGGPSEFKQIEWIEFPANWTIQRKMGTQMLEPFKYSQDLSEIKKVVDSIGQFEVDYNRDALRIYGYK